MTTATALETDELTFSGTQTLTETARLVVAAQNGDRDAFAGLVEMYQPRVFAIAMRRLGNEAESQELAQEVFIKAMCKIEQLREPNCFSGWLRSITTRMAINRLSRRRPDFATAPEVLVDACVDPVTPAQQALDVERRTWLREGLGRLGENDRATLVAFYFDGHSILEMSDRFNSPVGTIKRRLHVARKRLAAALTESDSADGSAPLVDEPYGFGVAAAAQLAAV